MGYDIHITRRESWFEKDDSDEIKLTEWTHYVMSDPEMKLEGNAEAIPRTGDKVTYDNAGLAVWTSYSKHGQGDNRAWFDFAGRLNAKVQGDDGETYDTKEELQRRPWWKVW
jgi:hypothetical protein